MLLRFILELRHPLKLAERRERVKNPAEFSVLLHVRLYKDGCFFWVKPAREQVERELANSVGEFPGVVRNSQRMVIHNTEQGRIFVL